MANKVSILILTYNEEAHIERCITSLLPVTKNICVVDSYSTDSTVEICKRLGVKVYFNSWKNYASQFQWGLDNCDLDAEWIMRMDADEYIEEDLQEELLTRFNDINPNIYGFYVRRKYIFLGKWIKYGAVYPLELLRVWRQGKGRIESRWMDEHIVLKEGGLIDKFDGHIVDENLNNTSWWTDKHNKYADREMIDILDKKYNLFSGDNTLKKSNDNSQAKIKRVIKEVVYNRLPLFVRPTLYFLYRYVIKLGFIDGRRGFAFHFMQGYWYRCLVDLRVYEAEKKFTSCASNQERIDVLKKLTGLDL